jgi:uncharacterized membrane protein YeaQ/YmgE (transglycosylase-associated protein family)
MKAARIFTMLLVARAVYGIVYLAATAGRWPLFWYYPLERRWAFEATPEGFAMGWFGTTALAIVAAALASALVWLVSAQGRFARAIARPEFVIAIARAGAMILLVDFVYFGWTLTHQTPNPLPAPACESAPP